MRLFTEPNTADTRQGRLTSRTAQSLEDGRAGEVLMITMITGPEVPNRWADSDIVAIAARLLRWCETSGRQSRAHRQP
ncbi:hypothetical protein T261_1389 [Streptomyces lydicus]|nr:hypothetical protein T261_1389 [Streptomyces lydicus]